MTGAECRLRPGACSRSSRQLPSRLVRGQRGTVAQARTANSMLAARLARAIAGRPIPSIGARASARTRCAPSPIHCDGDCRAATAGARSSRVEAGRFRDGRLLGRDPATPSRATRAHRRLQAQSTMRCTSSGKRAAVQRDSATLVGDTIMFNDSTQIVEARGDTRRAARSGAGAGRCRRATDASRTTSRTGRASCANVTTAVESGQRWIVHGGVAAFKGDTTAAAQSAFYARDGWITSCKETEPHYHFARREMKLISRNIIVARPAVLYIADIPVLWLPFVFQDMRSGRRSGIIRAAHRLQSDLPRNQSAYRAHGRGPRLLLRASTTTWTREFTDGLAQRRPRHRRTIPGWVKVQRRSRYSWQDRFIDGEASASSHHYLRNGSAQPAVLAQPHAEVLAAHAAVSANFNYVTNTTVQRQHAPSIPIVALQTIASHGTFATGRGPFHSRLGGTQTAVPGPRPARPRLPDA